MKHLVMAAVIVGLSFGAVVPPSDAHHSFASEFDRNKPVEVSGIVTKVEWNNPHVWFYMDVENAESGEIVNWGFEMGAPHQLQRAGWTRDTMTIGDELIVQGSLARDGSPKVNARTVTTFDGQVLGAASSDSQTLGSNSRGPGAQ